MKRFLAVAAASVMVLSMAACGQTQKPAENPTEAPAADAGEVSVDFEDGKCDFVLPCTMIKAYDKSVVSVQDVKGSKVCYAANQGGASMVLGVDISSLLGDNVSKVAKMNVTIGTQYADNKFYASSGNVYANYGEANAQAKLGAWSVYLENKNPNTYTFDLAAANVAFVPGCKNYISVAKETDNGVNGDLYIDNLAFFDADGNIIEADTSVVFDPADGYVGKADEPVSEDVLVLDVDPTYEGDWAASVFITNETDENILETLGKYKDGMEITFNFKMEGGYDFAGFKPINYNGWTQLIDESMPTMTSGEAADLGDDDWYYQNDYYILLKNGSSNTNTSVTMTLAADQVQMVLDAIANDGWGGLAAQVYGVNIYEVDIAPIGGGSGASADRLVVDVDPTYEGDWAAAVILTNETDENILDTLAKFENGMKVTFNFLIPAGYDYAMFSPINYNGWAKLIDESMETMSSADAEAAGKTDFFYQNDNYIVLPGGSDNKTSSVTMTLAADQVKAVVDAITNDEWGGIGAQVYGVNIFEVDFEPLS